MESLLLAQRYAGVCRKLSAILDVVLNGPNWRWRALAVVLAVSLFRSFPSYDALNTKFVQDKWRDVQWKFDHPLADTSRAFPAGTHESNLTFRLTAPVAAHGLHLGRAGMLILSAVAGIVLLFTILSLAEELTGSRRAAFSVCLAVACAWPGVTAFHELRGGYYDALALCLVALAFAARLPLLAGVLVFLAAWTDERALLASSFLFLFPSGGDGDRPRLWSGKSVAVLAAMGCYATTRWCLAGLHSGGVGGVGLAVLAEQTNVIPLAVWSGLAGGWLLVLLAVLGLVFQGRIWMAVGLGAVVLAVLAGALMVVDVTRGAAYCLPAVFVALSVLGRGEPVAQVERYAAGSAVVSLVVPTYYLEGGTGFWWLYPLPVQVGRWVWMMVSG